MKIDALVAGVGVLIFSSKRRSSGMGATLLKGQGFIVCTHIKEKLGMFLCSDLVRKYYIMQFPSKALASSVASPDELHAQRRRLHRFPEEQQDTFEFVADELSILRKRLRSMVVVEYLDQLGMASKYNTKVFCMQTLIGGNYGLLDTKTFLPILITQCSAMASAYGKWSSLS
ncbi:uncharacterized protein [Triticum aestivum]|uniref:uncharacterized protein isoform X8 n=1 Tax=Triticum aestivum TaxID=4565 RepID=UPI001D01E2DE|nr:uncharacterized protein LOC123119060 isoform X8 [Triticum aestivum]